MKLLNDVNDDSVERVVLRIIFTTTPREMFDSVSHFIQFVRSGLLGHVPSSSELSLGAAATITASGVDRDHPFHVGEAPVVKDRGALRGERGGPLALADQRVVG